MEKIVRFFECLAPISICNLECEYCYLIQQNRRNMNDPEWDFTPEHVSKALTKKRLGGMCYFSICGTGETLLSNDVIKLASLLLEEGHIVNITTNGTLTKQIEKLLSASKSNLENLHLSFSFHYIELKKRGLLDVFFENIKRVRNAGCSFVLQLNMYDGYYDYIDEIKQVSIKNVGALPQIALTRKDSKTKNDRKSYEIYTAGSIDKYLEKAREFESPLFECTYKNFNVKRKEFCYAGLYSGVLDLKNGELRQCYMTKPQNIFSDIEKEIIFSPVGKNCPNAYCINSSHFLSFGLIPQLQLPSYSQLRNREEADWYSDKLNKCLSVKLTDGKAMSWVDRAIIDIKNTPQKFRRIISSSIGTNIKSKVYNLLYKR